MSLFVNLIAIIAAALTFSVTAQWSQSTPYLGAPQDLVLNGRYYLSIPVPRNDGAYTYAVWMKLDTAGADNPVLLSQVSSPR